MNKYRNYTSEASEDICKLIASGFSDQKPAKVVIGFSIYALILMAPFLNLLIDSENDKQLHFEGLEDSINITYGEQFDYLKGISLAKDGESIDGTITYEGTVDVLALGDYTVTYTGVFEEETITKEIKISVVPFYKHTYVTVLENFTVVKTGENEYTISGIIINNSGRNLSKVNINYYCKEIDTTYEINFSSGMPTGEQNFSIKITSSYPLDKYTFTIDNIVCY